MKGLRAALFAFLMGLAGLWAQEHMHQHEQGQPIDERDAKQLNNTTHAMSEHMDMGPHMKLSELRPSSPADQKRAEQIVADARAALEQYKDYHAALNDSFHPFLPGLKGQRMVHFTNYWYAAEAAVHFNAAHPTSLLYEKKGDGYKLIGAMYTAPAILNEDELDKRIPLSVAQWHMHVNLCTPPPARRQEAMPPNARFGLAGSISTKEECESEGGHFLPRIFGWMIHMYPYEKTPEEIWSLERQRPGEPDHHH
jgi:hypothetical protein